MPVKYIFTGEEDMNVGRFGLLRKGDILNLNEAEAAVLMQNPVTYLEEWDGKKKLVPSTKMDPAQERARRATLGAQNDEGSVRLMELRGKSKEDLLGILSQMKAKDKSLQFNGEMSVSQLVRIIVGAERESLVPAGVHD